MSKVVLRLITKADLTDYLAIQRLTKWRKKNRFAYVGDYPITQNSVKDWLEKYVINNPDRFLFWVLLDNEFLGHVGIKNIKKSSVEIDNVSKGGTPIKGVMTQAMGMLLDMYSDRRVWLQVLEDNLHAIEFYKKLGFKETGRARNFIYMEYEQNTLR